LKRKSVLVPRSDEGVEAHVSRQVSLQPRLAPGAPCLVLLRAVPRTLVHLMSADRFPLANPGRLLRLADDMAGRAAEDEGFAALAVLAAHAVLESLVNELGRQEIQSFNERARFLPKWHDLCERTLGKQLDAAPDLERLHALRDGVAGFSGPPERLDRRSPTPPPEVPQMLSVETARWAVDAARRVVEEFHQRAGRERPDWLDWVA
jgi:hypothetical protein